MRVEYVDVNSVKEKLASLKSGKPKVSAKDSIVEFVWWNSSFKTSRRALAEGKRRARREGKAKAAEAKRVWKVWQCVIVVKRLLQSMSRRKNWKNSSDSVHLEQRRRNKDKTKVFACLLIDLFPLPLSAARTANRYNCPIWLLLQFLHKLSIHSQHRWSIHRVPFIHILLSQLRSTPSKTIRICTLGVEDPSRTLLKWLQSNIHGELSGGAKWFYWNRSSRSARRTWEGCSIALPSHRAPESSWTSTEPRSSETGNPKETISRKDSSEGEAKERCYMCWLLFAIEKAALVLQTLNEFWFRRGKQGNRSKIDGIVEKNFETQSESEEQSGFSISKAGIIPANMSSSRMWEGRFWRTSCRE